MSNSNEPATLKNIASHCKEYGFIFQSSEIYDGLSATYDYGPLGSELKNNIKNFWWQAMTRLHSNIVGIDAAIFMHPTTWKASGHIDAFNDPLIDNRDSKKRYRADHLIEGYIEKLRSKIDKELHKGAKKFGASFDEEQFLSTNPRVKSYMEKIADVEDKMKATIEADDLTGLKNLIKELDIADPVSGTKNWTDVRRFNLMFDTDMGSVSGETGKVYLRPETAQGIFVNYTNVQKTARLKPPFGIAQIGKAFRNEIIARQFIFRMREFEQMEMQFFVKPGDEMKWYEHWKEKRMKWHLSLGLGDNNYRYHDHLNPAHYANAACDIEFNFPMGFRELEGIHSRTDFDLAAHEQYSGKKLRHYDHESEASYIPYVIETSIGLDRMFLAVLSGAYKQERLSDNSERTVLSIPPALAPVKVAILPLLNKDGLPEIAQKIYSELKMDFAMQYDAKDAIGRRYRRQDAVGTPYCVTIDHQTLDDETVTIRDRDSMLQERINIDSLKARLDNKLQLKHLLSKL